MSFQRTRLRTAWVQALVDRTIAEDRVFDSRVGNIRQSRADEMLPLIAVYTENDMRHQKAGMSGPSPVFERIVDVVIELTVATWMQAPDPLGAMTAAEPESLFAAPQTDAELEAILDALEMQVWRSVFDDENAAGSRLRSMVKEFRGWDSRPGRAPEANNKISARQLTIQCVVQDDTIGRCAQFAPDELYPPYLSPLYQAIKSHQGYRTLRKVIEDVTGQTVPQTPTQIAGFNVKIDYVNHDTQAPDGIIDIEGDWPTPTGDESQ